MSMRDSLHIPDDELIQYALGTLPVLQLGNLTAHISLCNQCRAEVGKIQADLASFAAVQPLEELPAGARARFLARLESPATVSKFAQARDQNKFYNLFKSFRDWLGTPMPLKILSGALAAAMLFLAYDDAQHIHEIRQLLPEMKRFEVATAELDELKDFLRANNTQQVTLREKPQVIKSPEGHTIYSAMTGKLIFTASNMPTPPPGKAYELWVLPVAGGAPIPAGTFTPDTQGNAAIIFPPLPTNVQASGFGVTVENAAGSPAPTSAIILSGQ
jgi:anti-sigma-K factor RskA